MTSHLYIKGNGGNVGIGTSTPATKLEVVATDAKLRLNSGNASTWDISTNNVVSKDLVISSPVLTGSVVFSGTQVGIGVTPPAWL